MLRYRKPNRLRGCDYTRDRFYFITTCVRDRLCVFGEVIGHQMILNDCGLIADRQWYWMENQYPYIRIHNHIVMPNHVHAIIEINRGWVRTPNHDVVTDRVGTDRVGTGRDLSLHDPSLELELNIKIKPLHELIGAYKTTSSKQIHQIQLSDGSHPYQSFCWQRSFHDRIIRNQSEYDGIAAYIDRNPFEWSEDEFYR